MRPQTISRHAAVVVAWAAVALFPAAAGAQIKAQLPKGPMTPAWDKGIQPISRESYWNAVECGKQGASGRLCVFYDADLCKNEDFTLALYTPYSRWPTKSGRRSSRSRIRRRRATATRSAPGSRSG